MDPVGICDLDCKMGVPIVDRGYDKPTVTELRSVLMNADQRVDVSPILRLETLVGFNYPDLVKIVPAICLRTPAENIGHTRLSTLRSITEACALLGGLTSAAVLSKMLHDEAVNGNLEELLTQLHQDLVDALRGFPEIFGGPDSQASASAIVTATENDVAISLQSLNQDSNPSLDIDKWKELARACLAIAASNAYGILDGALPDSFNTVISRRDACQRPDRPWFLMGADWDQASGHAYRTIFGSGADRPNPQWLDLHYEYAGRPTTGGKVQLQDRFWFQDHHPSMNTACSIPIQQARNSGEPRLSCDEFPFFATEEGGQYHRGPLPHIEAIDFDDNRNSGLAYGRFTYQKCGLLSGTISPTTATSNAVGGESFLVFPMPTEAERRVTPRLAIDAVPVWPVTQGICNRTKPVPTPGDS